MIRWVVDNWQIITGALVACGAVDAAAGFIPDRYIPYIGIVRRFIHILIETTGRKTMKKVIMFLPLFLIPLMLFTSCQGVQNLKSAVGPADGVCVGPVKYVDRAGQVQTMSDPSTTTLCMLDPYPTSSKLTLFTVNDVALRKKAYTPDDVFKFTKKARGYLNAPNATVQSVVKEVLLDIKPVPELIIAGSMLDDPRFENSNLPIDDFTYYFLNKHLNEQDALASMFVK